MDYALSVIVGRALPDVRDGLKSVHKRIIYEMFEMGLFPDSGYRKSARIVGNVLGKWHPHGDTSVYDAMVRLAQDFNMRYTLIDGHGNWGSIDGDSPAHYRYTEAKLEKISLELIRDIKKNVVDFVPNFDGEEREPSVLPARYPSLLVNGSEGIAVGFATKMPPHNLKDSIDTVIYQIDNPNCEIKELVNILKAPDFPTKALITNPKNMINIYTDGHGKINMRAKHHIEYGEKNNKIIITEIPYQINKSVLIDEIYELTQDKKVEKKDGKKEIIPAIFPQIINVVDESDREGMRISLTLKKGSDIDKTLKLLFAKTNLQCNYSANFTAIHGTTLLEHMSLKDINSYYINHQKEVITRRTQFDLNKTNERLHILEGLLKAINDIDVVVDKIRNSKNKEIATQNIMDYLKVDEKQANYIVEIKLYRLAGFEIEKYKTEYDELVVLKNKLQFILDNESELLRVLKEELIEIRDTYGDERRTQLLYEDNIQDLSKEDLIDDNSVTLTLTKQGYIKKCLRYSEKQNLKDGDEILQTLQTSNKSSLLMFTSKGRMFDRKTYDLEAIEPSRLGDFLPNLIDLLPDEKVIYICTTKTYDGFLACVFENGKVAKINLKSYQSKQNRQVATIGFNTESKLMDICLCDKDYDIFFVSEQGKCLITNMENFDKIKNDREIKGNQGIKLKDGNKLIYAKINPKENLSFTITTEKGKSKEYYLDDLATTSKVEKSWYSHFKSESRNIGGNFIYNCRAKNDKIVDIVINK